MNNELCFTVIIAGRRGAAKLVILVNIWYDGTCPAKWPRALLREQFARDS
jgi:hypothetical protein